MAGAYRRSPTITQASRLNGGTTQADGVMTHHPVVVDDAAMKFSLANSV